MDLTSYNLKNTENKQAVPLPRTEYFKKSFSYRIYSIKSRGVY